MPITFSITCDTDEELTRFLEGLRFDEEFLKMTKVTAPKKAANNKTTEKPKAAKATAAAPKTKAAKPAKAAKASKAAKATKKSTKTTGTAKKTKAAAKTAAPKKGKAPAGKTAAAPKAKKASAASKKSGKLGPVINEGIDAVINKGKPFRTKDVVEWIVNKYPSLNENSITTGVSKQLNDRKLKYKSIKNEIGRSYKLFQP